jgi:hypothetical protein
MNQRYSPSKRQRDTGSTAGDAPRTVRQARDALQDAEDRRDAARTARDELKRQQADATGSPEVDAMRLRDAVAAVLKAEWQPRATALAEEIATTFADLIEKAELVTPAWRGGTVRTRTQFAAPTCRRRRRHLPVAAGRRHAELRAG